MWSSADCRAIDNKLNKFLRAMAKGAATTFTISSGYQNWSELELHRYWRFAPMRIELVVRHLGYDARVARSPEPFIPNVGRLVS